MQDQNPYAAADNALPEPALTSSLFSNEEQVQTPAPAPTPAPTPTPTVSSVPSTPFASSFASPLPENDVQPKITSVKPGFFSHTFSGIIQFFAHHKTPIAFLFVMVTLVVFYTMFSAPKIDKELFPVTLGEIKQYVKVTGQVEASKDANLSFQTNGQVSFVGVKVGDTITQGKVLATLSAGDAHAVVLQAEANLGSAQATLSQLQQGARKEEVALKEQTVTNTKSSLDQAYYALPDTIQNVDATTADVIKNKFSSLFVLNNSKYILSFSSCDQRLQRNIEEKRTTLENVLADFQTKSSLVSTISSTKTIDATFESAYQSAIMTNDLVNAVSNLLLSSCSITNSNLDSYRTTLSVVKTTMTSLFSDITVKRSTLLSAKNAFNQATRDLELTKAGTDPYKIKAQTALVTQARAQVATARLSLSKTILNAPFSGVVTMVNLSEGETVSAAKTIITMIALDGFEIEAKVPEIDIAKIKGGASAQVTLDAYGKDVFFPANVTRINPSATMEGSVPMYKIIVTFVGSDARIKQGMTANVQVLTDSKIQTIAIPSRFVKIINGERGTVSVLTSGKEELRDVTLGVRGDDGLIEIRSGLVEGDTIVSPKTGTRGSQKQTN